MRLTAREALEILNTGVKVKKSRELLPATESDYWKEYTGGSSWQRWELHHHTISADV
jgi:hypothetical protein